MVVLGFVLLVVALVIGGGVVSMAANTSNSDTLVFFGHDLQLTHTGIFLFAALIGAIAMLGIALMLGKVTGAAGRKRAAEQERERAAEAEAARAELIEQHRQELGRQRQLHEQELARVEQTAAADRDQLAAQHEQELARNREDARAERATLAQQHERELVQHREKADAERAALIEQHEQQVARERQAVREAVEEAQRSSASEASARGGAAPEASEGKAGRHARKDDEHPDDADSGAESGEQTAAARGLDGHAHGDGNPSEVDQGGHTHVGAESTVGWWHDPDADAPTATTRWPIGEGAVTAARDEGSAQGVSPTAPAGAAGAGTGVAGAGLWADHRDHPAGDSGGLAGPSEPDSHIDADHWSAGAAADARSTEAVRGGHAMAQTPAEPGSMPDQRAAGDPDGRDVASSARDETHKPLWRRVVDAVDQRRDN